MDKQIIKIANLTKTYGDMKQKIKVLDDVGFSLEKGNFAVLFGPSGSGKSTLLNLIGMMDKPTSGSIEVDDTDILKLSDDEQAKFRCKKLGFVFQFDSLLPEFSVSENIDLPNRISGDINTDSSDLIKRLGIEKILHKMPSELSSGEKQRAAIARALKNNPSILLADEPTGNLDAKNSETVFSDFKMLAEHGTTIVMATHNPEAKDYASRVLELNHGKIVQITK
jgi:ABC-type lipoprotein export system ATPase subunit